MPTSPFNYDDWEERIFAYVSGDMPDVERKDFEALMAQIPELQEAVEFDTLLKEKADTHFLSEYIKANWSEYMDDKSSGKNNTPDKPLNDNISHVPAPPTVSFPIMKGLIWGLGILVVGSIGYFMYQTQKAQAREARIESFVKDNFPHLVYSNTTMDDDSAVTLYKAKRYAEAETLFIQKDTKGIMNPSPAYALYRAYNALFLEPPHTEIGLKILENLYKDKDGYQVEDAEWYLILAYLQKKKYIEANIILQNIFNRDLPQTKERFENAQELMNVLQN